jgi:hypothetical protein
MKFEDARAAIYARINTGWGATYPTEVIEWENRQTVDRDNSSGPFLAVEVLFNDGYQAELGSAPMVRYNGAIYCVVYVRQGQGSKLGFDRLDYLAGLLGVTAFGGVNTQAPRPVPGHDEPGWYRHLLRIPFFISSKP